MDINKLKSFLMLADTLNYSEAAKQLYISQPALSKRIHALENELNVPLFDYVSGQTYLTAYGKYFKSVAEQLVGSYDYACERIHQMVDLKYGEVRFGTTHVIGAYMMPEFLSHFQNLYPNIKLNITISSSHTILDMLRKNQLEFVVVSDYILDNPELYLWQFYCVDHLKLIVGRHHPLFGQTHCSEEQVKENIYITKGPDSSQYRFLRNRGIQFPRETFISNQEAIKECVIHNMGVAIMSSKMVKRETDDGLLCALSLDGFQLDRAIDIVFLKGHNISPAAKAFLELFHSQETG